MIVRERADGSLILIAQTDHAKLSGQCAAHWGNKISPARSPMRPWSAPPCFTTAAGTTTRRARRSAGHRQAAQLHSGGLGKTAAPRVRMGDRMDDAHRSLFRPAGEQASNRSAARPLRQDGQSEDFQYPKPAGGQRRFPCPQRRNPGGDHYATTTRPSSGPTISSCRLLTSSRCSCATRTWSTISSNRCRPPMTARSAPARLTVKTIEGNRIAFDPFPFDLDPLRVQLVRREVDRSTFPDAAAFREAYFKATPVASILCCAANNPDGGATAVKAIRVHAHGGPEAMVLEELPLPSRSGQVLVEVKAAASTCSIPNCAAGSTSAICHSRSASKARASSRPSALA